MPKSMFARDTAFHLNFFEPFHPLSEIHTMYHAAVHIQRDSQIARKPASVKARRQSDNLPEWKGAIQGDKSRKTSSRVFTFVVEMLGLLEFLLC